MWQARAIEPSTCEPVQSIAVAVILVPIVFGSLMLCLGWFAYKLWYYMYFLPTYYLCCCGLCCPLEAEEKEEKNAPLPPPKYDMAAEVPAILGGGGKQTTDHNAPNWKLLQRDLVKNARWTGDFWTDLKFCVFNRHPLLGMFLCHPAHPFTKKERRTCFALLCIYTVSGTFLYEQLAEFPDGSIRFNNTTGRDRGYLSKECCWQWPPDKIGMSACQLDNKVTLFAFVTLPVMVVIIILTQLATSKTRLPSREKWHYTCASSCLNCVECACVKYSFFLAVCVLIVAILVHKDFQLGAGAVTDLVRSWIESLLQQGLLWLPKVIVNPFSGFLRRWNNEHSRYLAGMAQMNSLEEEVEMGDNTNLQAPSFK